MKRAIIVFAVAAMVLLTTGMWLYSSKGRISQFDLMTLGPLVLIIAFAVLIGFRRLGSARRGEPQEDELSKKVLQRTAAFSYYISLYLWVAMLYIKDRVALDTGEVLGAGILGMAISFAGCWLVFNYRGIRNG